MNISENREEDERLDDAAAAWLCERDEGFPAEREREFAEWCERDPRHAAAVARVERALNLIEEMPAIRLPLEARFGRVAAAAAPAGGRSGRLLRFPRPARSVAIAAAVAVIAVGWWNLPPRAPEREHRAGEHYATGASAHRRVALRDGSVLDINRATTVEVDFSEMARRVRLSAGEAHFQVASDAARPFVVRAGEVSVRAVGTAFNVRIEDGAVDVLVLEGKVEVVRAGARALVAAGERTQVPTRRAEAQPRVEKAPPEVIRAALSWQDPMTTFNDVPLREVAARMNQRNVTQLVLDDRILGERRIGGVIALDDVEAFVRLLEQDGDVVAERRGPSEIALRRAR